MYDTLAIQLPGEIRQMLNRTPKEWISPVSIDQIGLDTLLPNRLGRGERAVIAYAQSQRGYWVRLDHRQARMLTEHLGLKVVGIFGVLLRAKKASLVSSVRPHLDALHAAPDPNRELEAL